jgi:hypothetical protein
MRNPFKGTIRQLTADIVEHRRRITETEELIAALSARAGIDEGRRSGSGTVPVRHMPPRKRKRRRRKSHVAAVPKQTRRRTAAKVVTVAEPTPVAATAGPKPAVRGASKYAELLAELAKLRATIDTDDAAAARAYSIIVELKGRARLPEEYTKAVRMRLKRRAAAATKPVKRAVVSAPKKKAPRKPTPPPVPVHKAISSWTQDEITGVRSREVVAS